MKTEDEKRRAKSEASWSSAGQVLVKALIKCWSSVGQVLVKCWSKQGLCQVLDKALKAKSEERRTED